MCMYIHNRAYTHAHTHTRTHAHRNTHIVTCNDIVHIILLDHCYLPEICTEYSKIVEYIFVEIIPCSSGFLMSPVTLKYSR